MSSDQMTPTQPTRRATRRGRRWAGPLAGRAAVLVAVLVAALSLTAFAAGASRVGPHKLPAAFEVFASGDQGSGVITANGTYVLANVPSSDATIDVCTMVRGAHACKHTATLRAYPDDEFGSTVAAVSTGGSDVSVLAEDCCHIGLSGLVDYFSTNNGKTFSKEYVVGNLPDLQTALYDDGQILAIDGSSTTQVQAFQPALVGTRGFSPVETDAELPLFSSDGAAATLYKGGLIVANQDDEKTYVYYAPSGSDFNKSRSFTRIGPVLGHQCVTALSGVVLQVSVDCTLYGDNRIYFLNTKNMSFSGSGFKVPQPKDSIGQRYNMVQIGGVIHEFFAIESTDDVYGATTTNGAKWSKLTTYTSGRGGTNGFFLPILEKNGTGVLFETDGSPQYVQPLGNW